MNMSSERKFEERRGLNLIFMHNIHVSLFEKVLDTALFDI
jgi:hypothetical protein